MSIVPRFVSPLAAEKLHPRWTAERIPWEDSRSIPRNGRRRSAQPRALEALELALHVRSAGYNVYLSGLPDLGRTYMVCNFLESVARRESTPPDILYVNNFEDEDRPVLVQLPAGQGLQLKKNLAKSLQQLREIMPEQMESEDVLSRRREAVDHFHKNRASIVDELETMAEAGGFVLEIDDQGSLSLFPLLHGKRMSDEELARVDVATRRKVKHKGEHLLQSMASQVHRLGVLEKEFRQKEKELESEVLAAAFDDYVLPVRKKACQLAGCGVDGDALDTFFDSMRKDILEHPEFFLPRDILLSGMRTDASQNQNEAELYRYDVHVLVDNGRTQGAPVVVENHPTFSNLLGAMERESEMGALITDFTLIKAGALHRANGGYLILHAGDVLANPGAWEGLVRALRSGVASIEDLDMYDSSRVKGIEPEPMPLNVKVILIGDEDLYETLLERDERFPKLFKVKAQMTSETVRTVRTVRLWLCQLACIMDESDLLPFTRDALAGLVDYGSELCEDHRKISLCFPIVREALIEASAMASMRGLDMVDLVCLQDALKARRHRSNFMEEMFMEQYDRDLVKIRTSGTGVGIVNGLAVTTSGDYEFGLPHQISCTVGVGHGGIIDLEREAELGGPIHTKAMMILKSYLTSQFAYNKPLVLSGSICFEQSYTEVEGDSASGAELAALLSALANVPVRLSLAFTGAVSQSGQIMAVGGVTHKIEGFFNLCSRRGLTGEQGVIIPKDNVEHLMLDDHVVAAVREGRFAIYPVTHIRDALELLTGLPVGRRLKNGSFTHGSLFDKVDARLQEFGWLAEHSFKTRGKRNFSISQQ